MHKPLSFRLERLNILLLAVVWACLGIAHAAWIPPATPDILISESDPNNSMLQELKSALEDIHHGGDVNKRYSKNKTALILATELGQRLAACYLVAKKANVNIKDAEGKRAIDYANHDACLQYLLATCSNALKPIDPIEQDKIKLSDISPLQQLKLAIPSYAHRRRCKYISDLLLCGADPNEEEEDYTPSGDPIYPVGCHVSSPEHIALLVRFGWTTLNRLHHPKCFYAKLPACIDTYTSAEDARLLLTLGLTAPDPETQWALAAIINDIDGMKQLLNDGELPPDYLLYMARSKEAVEFLLAHGLSELWTLPAESKDMRHGGYFQKVWWANTCLTSDVVCYGHGADTLDALLNSGATLPKNSLKLTLLHEIGKSLGDEGEMAQVVTRLKKVDVNAKARHDWTPLHCAAQYRNLHTVTALLKAGADPNAKITDGSNALHIMLTPQNLPPLAIVALREKKDNIPAIIAALAQAGIDVNAPNNAGNSPLKLCCENANPLAGIALLKAGAKPSEDILDYLTDKYINEHGECDICPPEQMCAFIMALRKAGIDIYSDRNYKIACAYCPQLLKKRTKKNPAPTNLTPRSPEVLKAWAKTNKTRSIYLLTPPVERADVDLLEAMLKLGISPHENAHSIDLFRLMGMCTGLYSGHWMNKYKYYIINDEGTMMQERWAKIAQLLAKAGANPTLGLCEPWYDSWLANTFLEDPLIVQALIDAGADVNHCNKEGLPPLRYAGNGEVVLRLVRAGADINARDKDGNTVLMRRTITDHKKRYEIFSMLLKLGARTNIRNKKGETVYDMAAKADAAAKNSKFTDLLNQYKRDK